MDRPSTLPSFDPTPSGSTFTESIEYKLEIIPPYLIIQCRRADIVFKRWRRNCTWLSPHLLYTRTKRNYSTS